MMELIMMELVLAKVGGGEAVTNDTEEVAVAEEKVEEGINEENKTEEALDEAPGDENPPEEGDNASFLYLVIYFANPLLDIILRQRRDNIVWISI